MQWVRLQFFIDDADSWQLCYEAHNTRIDIESRVDSFNAPFYRPIDQYMYIDCASPRPLDAIVLI